MSARLLAALGGLFRFGDVRLRGRIQHTPQHVVRTWRTVVGWLRGTHPEKYSRCQPETKGAAVFRLSGAYIYNLALKIKPLTRLGQETTNSDAYSLFSDALTTLEGLLGQTVFKIPATRPPALNLKAALENAKNQIESEIAKNGDAWKTPIDFMQMYDVRSKAQTFEPVLLAELQIADIYVVTAKGGFDTTTLAEDGLVNFPSSLAAKVPDATADAKQAARCIAFDLPTASAFHMHRANEAVIHKYYESVAPDKPKLNLRAVEHWLKALEDAPKADKKVIAALRDLQTLHRNPVVHPEDTLDSIEDAIALHGAIYTAMLHMLKAIPLPQLQLEPPPTAQSVS